MTTAENPASLIPTLSGAVSLPRELDVRAREAFVPQEPRNLAETGLAPIEVEALLLKVLLNHGAMTGRKIAEQVKLPFAAVFEVLRGLKTQMLLTYKASAPMNDYEHDLLEAGIERAQRWARKCTYCGAAPVPLRDYVTSVEKQSVRKAKPRWASISAAFSELSLSPEMLSQIGQAVTAGRGMFLYGSPGNGKTSIAERVIRSISDTIWIPRTIAAGGEIIRLFDPSNHEEVPVEKSDAGLMLESRIDKRWVRIKRPTVVVGGELTLEHLEVSLDKLSGILEAPLQMKSNCGAMVIDDFGRQRISTTDLLNRWIVPLEKGFDFQTLPAGRQIQVPFDQLLVFATNLRPQELVDEAFLRRIPYKVQVSDPSEAAFRRVFEGLCAKMGIAYDATAIDYLIVKHYKEAGRPMRYCHPRDLLLQVRHFCDFHERPAAATSQAFDEAIRNYFGGL